MDQSDSASSSQRWSGPSLDSLSTGVKQNVKIIEEGNNIEELTTYQSEMTTGIDITIPLNKEGKIDEEALNAAAALDQPVHIAKYNGVKRAYFGGSINETVGTKLTLGTPSKAPVRENTVSPQVVEAITWKQALDKKHELAMAQMKIAEMQERTRQLELELKLERARSRANDHQGAGCSPANQRSSKQEKYKKSHYDE